MPYRSLWLHHRRRFLMDAARWIEPGAVGDVGALTRSGTAMLLVRHVPLRAMALHRLASLAHDLHVRAVPSWLQRTLLTRYGLEILPDSDIGGGLYIAHPVGCTLIAHRMGENCSVMAAATFGRTDELRWPTFGDRVFIGAGARVLGGIHLGDDARIGANAVVLTDVPAGAVAAGVPARFR